MPHRSNTLTRCLAQRLRRAASLLAAAAILAAASVSWAATVVRDAYVQNTASDAATIRWRTDVVTDSKVWYGVEPGVLDQSVMVPGPVLEHEIRLTDLSPQSTYYYAVGSESKVLASGTGYVFETAPGAGARLPLRLWVTGDSGLVGDDQLRVRDSYLGLTVGERTDVWLSLGDNAYFTGTDAEYQAAFFGTYPSILRTTPVWSTRGNHDNLYSDPERDYFDHFTFPAAGEGGGVPSGTEAYYSFDFANVHFVCLDSEGSSNSPGSPMLTWLANDLASTTQDWILAYWHHAPYTKGSHDSDMEGRPINMRQNVVPILEAGGVDLVLCGHSHSYERSMLIDGHYGFSPSLESSMILNGGDGDPAGDGPYVKPGEGPAPHTGTVYAVVGSASVVHDGPMNHPVMETSLLALGSLIVDIDGDDLEARFLDDAGNIRDVFAIRKLPLVDVEGGFVSNEAGVDLSLHTDPNPAAEFVDVRFQLPELLQVEADIFDTQGRRVAGLYSGELGRGHHHLRWDGTVHGRHAMPGAYFVRLTAGRREWVSKVVWIPR